MTVPVALDPRLATFATDYLAACMSTTARYRTTPTRPLPTASPNSTSSL